MPDADPELIGIREWDGKRPVIVVPHADYIEPIQTNYPKAHVVALPDEMPLWITTEDAWCWWMQLYQADVTFWPIDSRDWHLMAPAAQILAEWSGVRTIRWAQRLPNDWAHYGAVETVLRDQKPHSREYVDWLCSLPVNGMIRLGSSDHTG